jgi:hypothetical protein
MKARRCNEIRVQRLEELEDVTRHGVECSWWSRDDSAILGISKLPEQMAVAVPTNAGGLAAQRRAPRVGTEVPMIWARL